MNDGNDSNGCYSYYSITCLNIAYQGNGKYLAHGSLTLDGYLIWFGHIGSLDIHQHSKVLWLVQTYVRVQTF